MSEEKGADTGRIEAFSDGVFAVAITLLIFNLQVKPGDGDLGQALRDLWPHYAAYALSFLVIGIIWAQHHRLFTQIRSIDHTFLLINVLFLMWIVFLPFPVGVLGDHLGKAGAGTAMSFYAITFLIGTIPFNLLWFYAARWGGLLRADADPLVVTATTRSYLAGPLFYLIDLVLTFLNPYLGFAFFCLLALFYALVPIPAVGRLRPLRPFTGLAETE